VIASNQSLDLLLEILGQMENGNPVAIVPIQTDLTTQQSADCSNATLLFLVRSLKVKTLPFRIVGTSRRMRFLNLLG
jgi:hypothetical protein